MPGSAEQVYGSEIHQGLGGYRGIWTPDAPLSVGDVGVLNGDIFQPQGSLSTLGIDFDPKPDPAGGGIHWTSSTGVEIHVKMAGESSAAFHHVSRAEAGVGFRFKEAGKAVMHLVGVHQPRVDDILTLKEQILERFKNGDWDPHWVVMTQVARADQGTVLVSNSSESTVEIGGEVDFGPADLANAELELSMRFQREMAFSTIASEGLTPIGMGIRLQRIWWRPWERRFKPALLPGGSSADGDAEVEDATIAHFDEGLTLDADPSHAVDERHGLAEGGARGGNSGGETGGGHDGGNTPSDW